MTTAQSLQARLAAAFAHLAHSHPERAEQAFQDILADTPILPEARFGLALAQMPPDRRTDPGDVLDDLANAETIVYPPAMIDAGRMLANRGAIDLAAKALRKAQRLVPLPPDLLRMLSRCELILGDPVAGEEAARQALAQNPDDLQARFRLARALSRQDRWEDAIAAYRMVLAQDGHFLDATASLAEALQRVGQLAEAEILARAVLAQRSDDIVMRSVLAKCLTAAGRYHDAGETLLPSLSSPDFGHARACILHGNPIARELNVEYAACVRTFWTDYSEILRGQGWFSQAIAEMQNPIAVVPEQHRPESRSAPHAKFPGAPHVTLVTYSHGQRFRVGQERVCNSALTVGEIDEAVLWTRDDLGETAFYKDHRTLLDLTRGAGYWAWKPFVIYNELLRRPDGDVVVYQDSGEGGFAFTTSARDVVAWCHNDPTGFLPCTYLRAHGKNSVWTKRDCFHYMGCDTAAYWDAPHAIATFSFWRNSAHARDFVRAWLGHCLDPRIVSDFPNVSGLPNHPGFLDHRHDQSILAIMSVQQQLALPVYAFKDINGLGAALRQSPPSPYIPSP